METNYIAAWTVSGAFAPVLSRNGGNELISMLSPPPWPPGRTPRGCGSSSLAVWTRAPGEALREHS